MGAPGITITTVPSLVVWAPSDLYLPLRADSSLATPLTTLIAERKTLDDEGDRLFQKGTKTIKEKSRLSFIDGRVDELKKEISVTRKLLSNKPV